VVVKLDFVPIDVIRIQPPQGNPEAQTREWPSATKVVLQVATADSGEQLYRGEARAVTDRERLGVGSAPEPPVNDASRIMAIRDAVYKAFWGLVEDVQRLKSAQAEGRP
jgi:hypothetical protein